LCNFFYARSAIKSQADIETQIQECRKFAEHKDMNIDGVFMDEGFSGLDDSRPSYSKLLESAKVGDTIIVSSAGSIHRDILTLKALEDKYNLNLLDREG